MISIIIISFNHEKYIGETIEGIIGQKVDRPLQIIIGDDGSTDKTPEIIQSYYNLYPHLIVPILREKNIGANKNYIDCYNKCTGKYVAMCEGDDYWSDVDKLQKQIDFLERNPAYVLCYTDIQYYYETTKSYVEFIQNGVDTIELKDMFTKNYVPTLTAVFRNGLITLPHDFQYLSVGDWPLFTMLAQHGKLKRLPLVTAVYRVHGANNFQANSYLEKKLKMTKATEFLYKHFQPEYRSLALDRLTSHYYLLGVLYGRTYQFSCAFEYLDKIRALIGTNWNFMIIRLKVRLLWYYSRSKLGL